MSSSLSRIIALSLCLLVAGCSVTPYKPLALDQVHTVGWFADIDERIHNVHTGITIFGNEELVIENDWQLVSHLERSLASKLEAAGYRFKRIQLEPEQAALFKGQCFSDWDGSYKLEACGAPIAAVLREHGVDVLITSVGYTVNDPFTQGPAQLPHLGFFSRGTNRPAMLLPYAHVSMSIFAGDPAEPRETGACTAGRPRDPSPWTKQVDELELADIAWLRPELESLLDQSAQQALTSSGLLPGGAAGCGANLPVLESL